MTMQDQSATEAFLSERARSGSMAPPEIVTTHISKVFVGEHAVFKLKRAVRFPYLDFSTPAARVSACEQELHSTGDVPHPLSRRPTSRPHDERR